MASIFALLLSACFVPRESPPADQTCTKCHGDSSRAGSQVDKAAPPFDIFGNTEAQFPGVGAHQLHLTPADTHGAVKCAQCHPVPNAIGDEGHNDGQTTFTGLTYDSGARRCTTACHGTSLSGVWTRPRSSVDACGTCHGVPPASPHPQAGSCAVCHADVLAADGGFAHPELHVDGTIQSTNAACDSCHGNPPSTGAHALHLSGGTQTKPVECATCHEVPARPATPRHPNGGRAELNAAVSWNTTNCGTACHGGSSPEWTSTTDLNCTSCHGAPPAAPHPQVQNCSLCHPNATGPLGRQMIDRTLHVNGSVEANQPTACDSCHGTPGTNAAPPRDTRGETATTSLGVGAHQSHVVGRGLARVVQCAECHVVPTAVVQGAHLDGVALVSFSGVARANLAQPTYQQGTCASAACHDIANYTSAPGGGTATTPRWTIVDGSQATCTSCHGMPPPLPHLQRSDCESCHLNATAQRTFVNPALHVDGTVQF